MILRKMFCMLGFITLSGCTTIGLSNYEKLEQMDFGAPETIRLCILKDNDVAQERVDGIMDAIKQELNQYGIRIYVSWIRTWERPGFWSKSILSDVMITPLTFPCDRLFAFVGRNTGDFLWGIILPEYLGMVETATFTKGFAVAEWGSLNQVLSFGSPKSIAVHEFYHLFGCKHDIVMNTCYDQIKQLKDIAAQERKAGGDFFPTMTKEGEILKSRNDVDNMLYQLFLNRKPSSEAK